MCRGLGCRPDPIFLAPKNTPDKYILGGAYVLLEVHSTLIKRSASSALPGAQTKDDIPEIEVW
jgi:hypothetical protein